MTARGGGSAFGFRTAYVLGQTNLKTPQSETEKHSDSYESEARHLFRTFCLLEIHRRAHNDRKITRLKPIYRS